MQIRNRDSLLLAVLIAAAIVLVAPVARAGIINDDASGFLRDRPAVRDGARPLSKPKEIVHDLICAEDCVVSGRVVVSARDAGKLGLAPASGRWVELGHFQNVAFEARTWKLLRIRLGRRIERRLHGSRVRIYAEAIAISLQSSRHGQAGWAFTYHAD